MRIQKTSLKTPTGAHIVDGYSTSTTDGYSCNEANTLFQGKFEKGRIVGNQMTAFTLGSETPSYKTITFEKTYTNPPIVLVNLGTIREKSYWGNINTWVRKCTNTGCDIVAGLDITSENETWVDYIVISMD